MLFFLNLEKRPVILLYWFAARLQISTVGCHKYASFNSTFNVRSDEFTPSFPKQKEMA